jgi:hypothetical protein
VISFLMWVLVVGLFLLLANAAQAASIRGSGSLLGQARADCRPQQVKTTLLQQQQRHRGGIQLAAPAQEQAEGGDRLPPCMDPFLTTLLGLRRSSCPSAAMPPRCT